MQESAAGIACRWSCFRTCCKAARPILQIGITRRRRAYARRLRRPFGRSNAKKRRRHGVFHLCPGNRRTRRLPLPPASCRNIRRNKSSPPLKRRGTVTAQAKVPTGWRRRPERPPDAVASFGLFVICIYHPIQPFKHLFHAFGFYDNQRFVDIDLNKVINRAYDQLCQNIEKHIGDKAVLAVVDQNCVGHIFGKHRRDNAKQSGQNRYENLGQYEQLIVSVNRGNKTQIDLKRSRFLFHQRPSCLPPHPRGARMQRMAGARPLVWAAEPARCAGQRSRRRENGVLSTVPQYHSTTARRKNTARTGLRLCF